jgi:hypothetical protein
MPQLKVEDGVLSGQERIQAIQGSDLQFREEGSKLISSLREGTELGVDQLLICGSGEILDNAR